MFQRLLRQESSRGCAVLLQSFPPNHQASSPLDWLVTKLMWPGFYMSTIHPVSHNADYVFRVALEFTNFVQFSPRPGWRRQFAVQLNGAGQKSLLELPQELLLGPHKFGHLLRTVALNSLRMGRGCGIWMQSQWETDLFAGDSDHDCVMSESFFHLSDFCPCQPPALLPPREN